MISMTNIFTTAALVYALIALTTGNLAWPIYATGETLQQVAIVWGLILAFVGAINWIFEGGK